MMVKDTTIPLVIEHMVSTGQLLKPLRYSDALPACKGDWWCKWPDGREVVKNIIVHDRTLLDTDTAWWVGDEAYKGCQWAGPIPKPEG